MKLIILIVSLVVIIWGVRITTKNVDSFSGDLNYYVTEIRDSHNLPPLLENQRLSEIALLRCNDMVSRNYFSHDTPTGEKALTLYNYGEYMLAGENLAYQYKNAFDTVQGWRVSQTHYDNLVNPIYKEVGYAVCNKDGNNLIVQILKG